MLADRLYCAITLRNYSPRTVAVPLVLRLAADFADVFEVRGVQQRTARGHAMVPKARRTRAVFGYEGVDRLFRQTTVELQPRPAELEVDGRQIRAGWEITLAAGEQADLSIEITPSSGEQRPARRALGTAKRRVAAEQVEWLAGCARLETDNELYQEVIAASLRDLHALITPIAQGRIPAAGIPGSSRHSAATR